MFIGDWLARGARDFPDRLAVVDSDAVGAGATGLRLSYGALNERADRLAHWLRGRGVRRGDRVGLLDFNGVAYLDAFFACGKLGAVFVPYNFRLHPRELGALLDDTAPRVLLFGAEFAATVTQVASERPAILLQELGVPYEAALAAAPADPVTTDGVTEEDIACLLFTGGTTGTAKGARISNRMIAWNTLTTLVHEVNRDDVTVIHTPMFHTGGLLVYTLPLLIVGGTVVILRRWDPERLLDVIARERVTMLFCVPTQYQQLVASPRFAGTDLSSLRFLTSGGAPLPVALLRAFRAVHPVPFKQGFGMTEFGPGIFSMGAEFAEKKEGSIGRPNCFIEARVVDEDGRDVPHGQPGELWLRGSAVCSGYFLGGQVVPALDAGGFFHTGDLCRVDDDGFYFVVDRQKDMFLSGGENVYPAEIERALYEHPGVLQCGVIGVPDERWGQVGRAFVVCRPGTTLSEDEVLGHLRERLARYKVPKSVVLVPELPLTAAGKIDKRALRAQR